LVKTRQQFVKVNPQAFFSFCSNHVPLLARLAVHEGEISEADVRRLIRTNRSETDELPETTWRNLKGLQILVPTEPGTDFYLIAEPVRKLISYLFDEAQAATPEMVRGCIESLRVAGQQLARSVEQDDLSLLRFAIEEIHQTLRRVDSDLDETHRCILGEVARYKTERRKVSVREKFQRIVRWMERYVDPMVEIVRPDGPLRATFDDTERLMNQAREHGLFNDLPALERELRRLRVVQRHALRIFQQCRRELQPLYESLRRSSLIAEGAALALRKLEQEGLGSWVENHVITTGALRWQNVPGDRAIEKALRRISEHPPEPPPVVELSIEDDAPADLIRRVWLDSLHDTARDSLPVVDLLRWLVQQYPDHNAADTLAGFTLLVFDPEFNAIFVGGKARDYETTDATLEAKPVELAHA
jgi:hypothetical protein